MNKINEQQQQQQQQEQLQQSPSLPPNGTLYCASIKGEYKERQRLILTRINELEHELNHLKSQLSIIDNN